MSTLRYYIEPHAAAVLAQQIFAWNRDRRRASENRRVDVELKRAIDRQRTAAKS